MASDFEEMMRELRRGLDDIFTKVDGAEHEMPRGGLSTFFSPVDPYNRWPVFAPLLAAVGVAALVAFSGVAMVAFTAMMLALSAVWFLLSEVFGYELSLAPVSR
ncbi:MAG: hypothetical protein HY899_08655 [Deltaproteobacteria bacterium]|nr:hypothetical protein [Deltaproteobacteria bacterium]